MLYLLISLRRMKIITKIDNKKQNLKVDGYDVKLNNYETGINFHHYEKLQYNPYVVDLITIYNKLLYCKNKIFQILDIYYFHPSSGNK